MRLGHPASLIRLRIPGLSLDATIRLGIRGMLDGLKPFHEECAAGMHDSEMGLALSVVASSGG
jgi:hypothetical protein